MWGISSTIVSLLMFVAWARAAPHEGDHGGYSEDHYHHYHHSAGEQPHSHDEGSKLSPANADFAFNLYRSLSAKSGAKNVFFSPLSITTALSVLSLGSRGETHSELFSTLGYSNMTQDKVNEAYEHLIHMMGHSKDSMQLEMGNALALRDDFKPLQKFLDDAKHYYAGEAFSVDFKDTVQAEAKINQFIAKKTHDKITDLVKDLSPGTAMVLINYVFFRGKWEKPFNARSTKKADFHVDDKNNVEVDMMRRTGYFDFYQDSDNHTTVIMLPYKGNTSMIIILPDEGKMKEVEGYINKDYVIHWHNSFYGSYVKLDMPKISISASSSLKDTLTEMGMVNPFGDSADFSGISEETKLKVSKIEHKAVLDVDETGTEAAAATTIEMVAYSLPHVEHNMKLNRPFLLLIVESSTKSILFMGKVSDPTAK